MVGPSIRFDFPASGSMVTSFSKFLTELYARVFDDADQGYRIGLTVHELLENLVKYAEGQSCLEVGMREDQGQVYAWVRTQNTANEECSRELASLFARFDDEPDAISLYDSLLYGSVDRDRSGLGLARIRAEAEVALACSIENGNVTIYAEAPVSKRNDPC